MSADDASVTLVVGQPWALTEPYRGPGINGQWIDPYMIVIVNGDRFEPRLDTDLKPTSPLTVGIAQFESMPVFLVKSPSFGTIDVAHPWIAGTPEPEVVPIDAVHILWHFVVVQGGRISSMHAFTTNAHVTKAARRIFAEQRSAGPVSAVEAQAAVDRWRAATETEKGVWKMALATGKPGD